MVNKSEKIIICGKSGSGKDHLLRELTTIGFKPSVKITTRPKRNKEIDGVDYKFISDSEFENIESLNELLVYQDFTNDRGDVWKYGILNEDFSKSQIFIMTPDEISQLNDLDRKKSFVVYLDIDRPIRESRLYTREDRNDSVSRRLDSDENDFKDFREYDLRITDPEFTSDLIIDLMN